MITCVLGSFKRVSSSINGDTICPFISTLTQTERRERDCRLARSFLFSFFFVSQPRAEWEVDLLRLRWVTALYTWFPDWNKANKCMSNKLKPLSIYFRQWLFTSLNNRNTCWIRVRMKHHGETLCGAWRHLWLSRRQVHTLLQVHYFSQVECNIIIWVEAHHSCAVNSSRNWHYICVCTRRTAGGSNCSWWSGV